MTLIASIKTKQGIVMTADSKEIVIGGQLLWTDFETILESKSLDCDSAEPAISPYEIKEVFRATAQASDNGRIKSTDTGLKLFQVTDFAAFSTTDTATPGGLEFTEVIKNIKAEINERGGSFETACDVSFTYLKELFEADGEDRYKNKIIFCGYDEVVDTFRSVVFFYNERRLSDGNNGFQKDEKGNLITERYFHKLEIQDDRPLTLKGWTNCLQSLDTFNQAAPDINLEQGFVLLQRIMALGVAIEEMSHTVTGIGGKILFAVITKKGFSWVENEACVRNLLSDQ